jgi:hypothetical protein
MPASADSSHADAPATPPGDFNPKLVKEPVVRIDLNQGVQRTVDYIEDLNHRRALRWELRKCYRRAGVNHYTECRIIAHAYMKAIQPHVRIDFSQ